MITVRRAVPDDAMDMVFLLNEIINIGGTTAQQSLFDEDRMLAHYLAPPNNVACHVAVEGDILLGFQALEWSMPDQDGKYDRPADWAYIASFVKDGQQGKGVGVKLFAATKAEAISQGVKAIDATIRADNVPGLAYYAKMGFREDSRILQAPLRDGTKIDRIRKVLFL